MSSGPDVPPRGGFASRLLAFYVILAATAAAVVIAVVAKGKDESSQPIVAGGYDSRAAQSCIGPPAPKWPGAPLPSTAPGQPATPGPSFNLVQSGQFINIQNNASTLG